MNEQEMQQEMQKEVLLCAASFEYFLKYVKIVEPPSRTNLGGVIDFVFWEHLRRVNKELEENSKFVWLKSRQIGASWYIAALNLWDVLFKHGFTILLLSKDEPAAIELLEKSYRIFNHLPQFLKETPDPKSRTEMGFPSMESKIKALSSTEAAGVSYTASRIVCDEWDLHPYASENYAMIQPCIDTSGGQFIGIFTRDPWGGEDSLAVSTFLSAIKGENGFKYHFDPFTVRPGRDEQWYELTRSGLSEQQLKGLTRELYMKKNYPRSIEEALATIGTLQAFDHNILGEMMGETKNPVRIEKENIDNSIIHVYKPYYAGRFYVCGIDTAHGVGKDYSVCAIMDVKSCEVVADIVSNVLKDYEFAWHCYYLLKLYNSPKCYPEDNDWGRAVINKLQEMDYKNFGYSDERKTKIGWHTDKKTRMDLWGGLAAAINSHQITIYNSNGIKQFYDVIRREDGEMGAKSGGNDDYPTAVGICWAKKDTISTYTNLQPISTLHF